MPHHEYDDAEHLAPLPRFETPEHDSSSSDDSEVEVTSLFDPDEHELIQLSTYLHVHSDDDDTDEDGEEEENNNQVSQRLVSYSNSDDSADEFDRIETRISPSTSNASPILRSVLTTSSVKLKRRQWSVKEKVQALQTLEKNGNKYQTCKSHGCSPSQLRKWFSIKDGLQAVVKQKNGKFSLPLILHCDTKAQMLRLKWLIGSLGSKRKRVNGGGAKVKYVDLDIHLLRWFREHRSPPISAATSAIAPIDIRREKVTFRRLQREGERISDELHHRHPSVKWYRRFLIRNRLSLQRPKRHQKIPIDEAHRLAHSFYSFLRRSSAWAPKRGPMGCFTPRDVFNMDESPLSLFGDQTKLSINDVNTCNEISGHLSNKVRTVMGVRVVPLSVWTHSYFSVSLRWFSQCPPKTLIGLIPCYYSKGKVEWRKWNNRSTRKVWR